MAIVLAAGCADHDELWTSLTTEQLIHQWIVDELKTNHKGHSFTEAWIKQQLVESERFLQGPLVVQWPTNLFANPLDAVLLLDTHKPGPPG
jgi:hypothetical protein